jgi:hypothetical protein
LDNREQILSKIKKALRRSGDTHTFEDVVRALQDGRMQSFWNETALVVTEIVATPRRNFVSVFLVAGDLNGVMGLHDKVCRWAIDNGYDFSRISVRPGFARLLEQRGWKKRQVTMELELHGWCPLCSNDHKQD